MANFTKTITNSFALFGAEQTSKWGTMTWGQNWAFGSGELAVSIGKVVSNSVSLDSTITLLRDIAQTISNALSISGDMSSEVLTDSNGWSRFWGSSTNAESRLFTSFTAATDVTTTYTPASDVTTTWTQQ